MAAAVAGSRPASEGAAGAGSAAAGGAATGAGVPAHPTNWAANAHHSMVPSHDLICVFGTELRDNRKGTPRAAGLESR